MNTDEIYPIYNELSNSTSITLDRSFELAKICSKLLAEESSRFYGRELAIRALAVLDKIDANTHPIWYDLIESCGLYPYLVGKPKVSGAGLLRFEFHKSNYLPQIYLHEEQMRLSLALNSSKSIIISAPTSFGKSLLIDEVVASKKYKNIVIIQPTLALLDETRKKFKKYQNYYNLIISTSQSPSEGPNLFLLTAERLVEYSELPQIDFFVIDEFYKLSTNREDDRASVLNYAFYRLLKMTKNFYLLGPNISSIPKGFEARYGAEFIKTDFSTVAVDIEKFENLNDEDREGKLFKLLSTLTESSLIYCASPDKANELLTKFNSFCIENNLKINNKIELENLDILEWMSENIHPKWKLREALTNSIALHHGSIPRHIGSTLIDYFNQGKIRYLFCTSTLIEGVNTSAKNVILFDKTKGRKSIDYFDFKNISGRSGRMKYHFIGKVYQFHPEPPSEDMNVDIPFFTQKNASNDLLLQLDSEDIVDKKSEKYQRLMALDPEYRELIKKNKGVSVDDQIAVINQIQNKINEYYPNLSWSASPNYKQLDFLIGFICDNFSKEVKNKHGVRTSKQLAWLTWQYINSESVPSFIAKMLNDTKYNKDLDIQARIDFSLGILRNWFDYKLPKLIKTTSEIQKFIFEKNGRKAGNYDYLSSRIENNLLPTHLAVLLEYDIPQTAIFKLKHYLKGTNIKDLKKEIATISNLQLKELGLIDYEISKLKGI